MLATRKFTDYLSLVKFSHTIFAMPFAMIGFILAFKLNDFQFQSRLFLLVLLSMVFARNAAMAFNRYLDRDIDALNPRTVMREIPAGVIKANSALMFVIVNCSLFTLVTWLINPICFYLSPIALLVILGYSFTKRFTALCHLVLGLGLSLAPIGAYLAVTGKFAILPLFFSFIVLFWVSGFDIIYALQDEQFDRSNRLKSIPVLLGGKGALRLSNILHFLAGTLIVCAGVIGSFGVYYWIGAAVFISLLFYQHSLVKVNDLSRVNLAFATLNGIGSLVFGIFVAIELLR